MSQDIAAGTRPEGVADAPRVLAPVAKEVFAHAARRFQALATGHSLADYLQFMGRLAQAQQRALDALPQLPLPDDAARALSLEHAMPLVPAQTWPRHPAWRDALSQILDALRPEASADVAKVLTALHALSPAGLEALAERVLRTELFGEHADKLPFIAAALQVYWTHLAAQLGNAALQELDVPGVCPCCGSLPSVSVIGASQDLPGRRYLHCSLCQTEWHLTRAQCSACDAGESAVAYQQIEGGQGLVQAETCGVCKCYLKVVRRDKDAAADPVADDLATLALDILVDEEGYTRSGPNLLLVPGGG
ncbi:MAG: formate dehydrogenase accessory protein FdhE [Betaproteobacteria bacterium]|nr:formate dehydrogenase accessory protein FdhE [Betaproteobacteria bacterium]